MRPLHVLNALERPRTSNRAGARVSSERWQLFGCKSKGGSCAPGTPGRSVLRNEEVERVVGPGGTVVPPGGAATRSRPRAHQVRVVLLRQRSPKAIRGPRPQASSPPGCITTPRPSLTSSCSSTTIYGCGSLTERQTPPHRRGPARQRRCRRPRALRHARVAARPAKASGRKRRYPADPWLRSPVVKAGLPEPAVDSRGGAGVPTADLARGGPSEVAGSVQLKRLR